MSSQAVPFDWKLVDQTLANAMLLEVSLEMNQVFRQDEQQIHFLNIGNENDLTDPSQRLQMQLLRVSPKRGT
jgi:hypothetical protein